MSEHVVAAASYEDAPDLCVVVTYFNPAGWRSRRASFERFRTPFAQSALSLFVVECAVGDAPFDLPARDDTLRVRAKDALWQKERLVNVAAAALPPRFTKLAWVDADVLFSNPRWAQKTSRLLDDVAVVQPFERGLYLPAGEDAYRGEGDVRESFSAVLARKPELHLYGEYLLHGVTGLAWAARRDVVVRHGIYDACLSGSGDHLIAHATLGDFRSPCVTRTFAGNTRHAAHFADWVARWKEDVPGRVGCVPGDALHLWHGDRRHRAYPERNRELAALGFDPTRDLVVGEGGVWEVAPGVDRLRDFGRDHFRSRREDGDA